MSTPHTSTSTSISIADFQGVKSLSVTIPDGVALFAGRNGAGKSTIADAVALALTGELRRITKKGEAKALLHDDAKSAHIEITRISDHGQPSWTASVTSRGVNRSGQDAAVVPGIALALHSQRFGELTADERRSVLFAAMGLTLDQHEVRRRLLARGIDAGRVNAVAPLVRHSMKAAHDEAMAQATQAKGAWREVTGEVWGSVKAQSWAAVVPQGAPTADDMAVAQAAADEASQALAAAQEGMGAAAERAKTISRLRERLEQAQAAAAGLDRIQKKMDADAQLVPELEDQVRAIAEARATQAAEACPECGSLLTRHAGRLVPATSLQASASAEDIARLPQLEHALATARRCLENDKRDMASAQTARDAAQQLAAELKALEDAAAEAGDANIRRRVSELQAAESSARQALNTAVDASRAATSAAERTQRAQTIHENICGWLDLADALAPGGVQQEVLAEACAPLNADMRDWCEEASWPQVEVDQDMGVTVGGLPYRLQSKSYRWRADALIAAAVARRMNGWRLLVLDEVDILDVPGRGDLFYWLTGMVERREIDTVLLAATLTNLPHELPAGMTGIWLEAPGKILRWRVGADDGGKLHEAAEAA